MKFHLLGQDDSRIHCESTLGRYALWPPEDNTKEFLFLSFGKVAFLNYLTLQYMSAGNAILFLGGVGNATV